MWGWNIDEIIKSINSETNNKPPGNDGPTAEFYKHFSNELAPFQTAFQMFMSHWGKLETMSVTYWTGIISAIYKRWQKRYYKL